MSIKEQVRQLWKLCFTDSDEFVELYFRMRYTDELNSYIEVGGKVVAALQRLPYPMIYEGTIVPTSYISGACTHPDYRNRGVMKQLLMKAHRRMYEDGVVLSTLIPAEEWLKAYYAKSGYAVCFQQGTKLLTRHDLPVDNFRSALKLEEIELDKKLPGDVFAFFDSLQNLHECRILHSAEDLQVVLSDLQLSGGKLLAAYGEEKLKGLCFCLHENGRLSVKELLGEDTLVEQQMLSSLFQYEAVSEIEALAPSAECNSDLGMARVIHVYSMLTLFARSHTNLYIQVVGDEAIPENNGFYNLENGSCTCLYRPDKCYQLVSIEELPSLLFEGKHPYMNLMLN